MTDVSQLNRYANIDGRVTYTGIHETETEYLSGKSNEQGVYEQILGNNYDKVFNKAGNLILFDYQKIMDYANPEAVSSEDFQHFTEDVSDKLIDQAIDDEGNIWLEDLVNYVSSEIYNQIEAMDLNQDKKISSLESQGVSEDDGAKVELYLDSFINVLISEDGSKKDELSDSDVEQLNQLYLKAQEELSEDAFELFDSNLFQIAVSVLLFDYSNDPENPIIKYEQ